MDLQAALDHARKGHDAFKKDLQTFLRIPSISTLSNHAGDVQAAAEWLVARLKALDMPFVELFATGGHPIVYAEDLRAPGKPTLLVYGHYDVQPVDPLAEWTSDPFGAEIRGDYVFARGASDMKGQVAAFLEALGAVRAAGPLPVNVKCLFEGEEEIGSPHLESFIEIQRARLSCDAVLNADAGILAPDQPAIVYALRGLAYFEVEVRGAARDLHSGLFGGVVHNPAQVLCELIAGMHDAEGRVTLPGFYDRVRPLPEEERKMLAQLPQSDEDFMRITGTRALWSGEEGYTPIERLGARPTLEVNGIWGGFTGEGSKTVLPAKATAKISTRLVPDQDPAGILDQLCAYLRAHAPHTVEWEVRELNHGPGSVMDRTSPAMRAAVDALTTVFGRAPLFRREGGSVPVVAHMQQMLGVDSIMLGFALPDDGIHGPNERQHLPTLLKGIETYIRFLAALGG